MKKKKKKKKQFIADQGILTEGKKIDVKKRLYEILEASKENDPASKIYDMFILAVVIIGLVPLTMKTENTYTRLIDLITGIIFIIDYIARIYTSDYKMGVKNYRAYVAYIFTPMALVDLLSITPILSFFIPGKMYIELFRLFKVLRVLKLIRYSKVMVQITNVLRKTKRQLGAVLVLALIYILSSALIIFQIEPEMFDTFFDALYWATISITTIGYGDIAPVSFVGRLITMISALVGVAIIALPSGIITAAFMDEIGRKKGRFEL